MQKTIISSEDTVLIDPDYS